MATYQHIKDLDISDLHLHYMQLGEAIFFLFLLIFMHFKSTWSFVFFFPNWNHITVL